MFSATSTLSKLIRTRPLIIETLEKCGTPFWNSLHVSVEAFCQQAGIDCAHLIHSAEITEIPQPNLDWGSQRFYRIIAFLKAEHKQFIERDLPLFHQALERHRLQNVPEPGLRLIDETCRLFEKTFLEHMRDEEDHIFPYLLLLEKAFLFEDESEFDAIRLTSPVILAELKHVHEEPLNRLALDCGILGDELLDFRMRLNQHAERETDILYARAREMEKALDAKEKKSAARKLKSSFSLEKKATTSIAGTQPWE